jgi:excisionase family DNA binding protein
MWERTVAEPLVYTVEQAAELLAIGRTAAYEAVRRGELPAIRIGRTLRISRHALERMLDPDADVKPERNDDLAEDEAAGEELRGEGAQPR